MTPDEDEPQSYNVFVPAYPEICTFGDSIEEARFMAQDALELVVLSDLEEKRTIPSDKKPDKLEKGAITDEIVVSVDHHVKATRLDHVKTAIFKTS